jgi:transcriptional regulator with XRE-family HTH domain
MKPNQAIKKSGVERTYGHQFFRGRRTPSRDKVIMLAFGFGLDYDETQEFLKAARKSPLHPKIMRDVVIIHALKNNNCIEDVLATLHELELPLLGKEERYN